MTPSGLSAAILKELREHEWDGVQSARLDLSSVAANLEEAVREYLTNELDKLVLHDNTGDPRDEGYMAALADVRDSLRDET